MALGAIQLECRWQSDRQLMGENDSPALVEISFP